MKKRIEYFFDRENEQMQFIQQLFFTYIVVFALSLFSFAADLPKYFNAHASDLSLLNFLANIDHNESAKMNKLNSTVLPLYENTYNSKGEVSSKNIHQNELRKNSNTIVIHQQQTSQLKNIKKTNTLSNISNQFTNAQRVLNITSNINSNNSSAGTAKFGSTNNSQTNNVNNQSQQVLASLGIETEPSLLSKLSEQAKITLPNQSTDIVPLPSDSSQAANIETFKQYYPEFFEEKVTDNSGLNLNKLEPIAPGSLNDPINCPDVNRYFSSPEARAGARAIQIARGCS